MMVRAYLCIVVIVLAAGPAYAALPPNLAPVSLTVTPEQPRVGQTATFTVKVVNKGGSEAKVTFYVAFYLDGTLCDTVFVAGGLKPGYEDTEVSDDPECQPKTPGNHKIRAVVDSGNDIQEGTEADNVIEEEWSWLPPPRPDLVVSAVHVEPSGDLYVNEQTLITVTIRNIGEADAKPFYVDIFLDAYRCDQEHVPFGLDPGEDVDLAPLPSACLPTNPGWHDILVVVDSTKTVEESDEGNNQELLQWKWYEWTATEPAAPEEPTPEAPVEAALDVPQDQDKADVFEAEAGVDVTEAKGVCSDGEVGPCPNPPDQCAEYRRLCEGGQWGPCIPVAGTMNAECASKDLPPAEAHSPDPSPLLDTRHDSPSLTKSPDVPVVIPAEGEGCVAGASPDSLLPLLAVFSFLLPRRREHS